MILLSFLIFRSYIHFYLPKPYQTKQNQTKPMHAYRAHGYNVSFFTSYNPVSRVDSERQSCSSGQTDSETKSLVCLK